MTAIDVIKNAVDKIQNNGVPYFDFGKWHEAVDSLTAKNLTSITQGQKFPLVFLLLDISETKSQNSGFSKADINLFIINKTEVEYKPNQRHLSTFPLIREISTKLLTELKKKTNFDDYSYKELFFDITKKNKLETVIDVIQLGISDMEYFFQDC